MLKTPLENAVWWADLMTLAAVTYREKLCRLGRRRSNSAAAAAVALHWGQRREREKSF